MKTKSFDCVEMKRRIQQEMAQDEARLGSVETKRVPRCFRWNHFRVRVGKLTPERCLEFGHFPATCCCNR